MYKKLVELLNISIDKYQHFALAAVFALVLRWVLYLSMNSLWSMAIAFIITVSICFIKDIVFDGFMKRGEYDWKDIVAGAIGALVGVL